LKSLVQVVYADPSSTDSNVVPGNAQATIIRPSVGSSGSPAVTATGLFSVPGLSTEIRGFTIANSLIGSSAAGPINPSSVGMLIQDSDVLVDKNYFIDSGIGIDVQVTGANAAVPTIEDDGVIGNLIGIQVDDLGSTTFASGSLIDIVNNTIALNTTGILVNALATSPLLAQAENNIFWENHDLSTSRAGSAIQATVANKIVPRYNMFSGNGPSETNYTDDTINVGSGFNPAALTGTPDSLGNFIGSPGFVSARDPRPTVDGPAVFYNEANFDLTVGSAAIDSGNNSAAPATDFLSRTRVTIPG
ncbi:DUF1565 domain-containing protein, partial [Singulisphaera rosea]